MFLKLVVWLEDVFLCVGKLQTVLTSDLKLPVQDDTLCSTSPWGIGHTCLRWGKMSESGKEFAIPSSKGCCQKLIPFVLLTSTLDFGLGLGLCLWYEDIEYCRWEHRNASGVCWVVGHDECEGLCSQEWHDRLHYLRLIGEAEDTAMFEKNKFEEKKERDKARMEAFIYFLKII